MMNPEPEARRGSSGGTGGWPGVRGCCSGRSEGSIARRTRTWTSAGFMRSASPFMKSLSRWISGGTGAAGVSVQYCWIGVVEAGAAGWAAAPPARRVTRETRTTAETRYLMGTSASWGRANSTGYEYTAWIHLILAGAAGASAAAAAAPQTPHGGAG